MPHGGKRPGAGRKPGSFAGKSHVIRKAARERIVELMEAGRDPLDILLNFAFDEQLDVDTRMTAAIAATPYVHPRLSSMVAAVTSTHLHAEADPAALVELLNAKIARLASSPRMVEAEAAE